MIDRVVLFGENQPITTSIQSIDTLDMRADGVDVGSGQPVELLIQVSETFNNCDSLTVSFQTSNSFGFGSPVNVVETSLPLADLVAGRRFPLSFIPRDCRRYIRIFYDVVGAAPSSGAITAAAVLSGQDVAVYPAADVG
jgi:hypothetical protein